MALDTWTTALWKDSRVKAAWPVTAEQLAVLKTFKSSTATGTASTESSASAMDAGFELFARFFKETVAAETVSDGIPPAQIVGRTRRQQEMDPGPTEEGTVSPREVERAPGTVSAEPRRRVPLGGR